MNYGTMQEKALSELLQASLIERRRQRRWGIFFKSIFSMFLLFFVALFAIDKLDQVVSTEKSHIALIDIKGVIADGGKVNADDVETSLDNAFKDKKTQAVILNIDSPGGSPVQSDDIYNDIVRLQKKHTNIPVYAVCSDICASGGYFIASAANKIYANPASLVGSIGVIMDGFGFDGALKKLYITRRLYTAGSEKGFLDPFSPVKPNEVEQLQTMLDETHQLFIKAVEKGRGDRLKTSDPELFTGRIWTGTQAKDLGLIDDFGSVNSVARDVIKNDNIIDYTIKPSYFEELANNIGASAGEHLMKSLGVEQNLKME